jgi:hypothetical protein
METPSYREWRCDELLIAFLRLGLRKAARGEHPRAPTHFRNTRSIGQQTSLPPGTEHSNWVSAVKTHGSDFVCSCCCCGGC